MISKINVRRLTRAGMLTGIVTLLTAYVRIVVPPGYVHMGDGAVILSGLVLGPFGAVPAALGSALAAVLAGFPIYAGFSALIKGVMGWLIGSYAIPEEKVNLRNIFVLTGSFIWMTVAYFICDFVLLKETVAYAQIFGNLVQTTIGMIFGIIFLKEWHRIAKLK